MSLWKETVQCKIFSSVGRYDNFLSVFLTDFVKIASFVLFYGNKTTRRPVDDMYYDNANNVI